MPQPSELPTESTWPAAEGIFAQPVNTVIATSRSLHTNSSYDAHLADQQHVAIKNATTLSSANELSAGNNMHFNHSNVVARLACLEEFRTKTKDQLKELHIEVGHLLHIVHRL